MAPGQPPPLSIENPSSANTWRKLPLLTLVVPVKESRGRTYSGLNDTALGQSPRSRVWKQHPALPAAASRTELAPASPIRRRGKTRHNPSRAQSQRAKPPRRCRVGQ